MPRRARFCPAGWPVHLIQRGHNRQAIFSCDADLAAYAHWLAAGAERFGVAAHGWVFMTNHVHLRVTPPNHTALSQLMQGAPTPELNPTPVLLCPLTLTPLSIRPIRPNGQVRVIE